MMVEMSGLHVDEANAHRLIKNKIEFGFLFYLLILVRMATSLKY